MKKIIRLTESDLHKIVKESVHRILKEGVPDPLDFVGKKGYDPFYDNYFDEDGVEYDYEGNPIEDDDFDDEAYYSKHGGY